MQSEPVIQSEIPLPVDAPPRRWRPRSSAAWNSSAADRGIASAVTAEELRTLQQAFERYEIIDCIERGGQGVVYRAQQKGSSRTVALKLLLDGPLAGERQRYRFEREIELIARLRHPNIVTLFDSGVTRGRLFYAMEFIDGLPIDDYSVFHDLSPHSIVQLMSLVCRAIHFAHQNGVIHRDLKPAHILVGTDGQPRVFDFGLAKDIEDSSSDGRYSCTGLVVGTLPYLSPEQAGGQDGESDVRSDVYALGVILFQLLAELFPYPVDGPPEQVRRTIMATEPLALRNAIAFSAPDRALRSHEVNRDLEAIVGKALRKEKAERYQSAAELADDLDRYLKGEAVTARAGSRWYVARKAIRKHRAAFGVAALVGTVLIGSGVAVSMSLIEAKRSLNLTRQANNATSGMVRFAINELEKSIRPLPGGVKVREDLIGKLGATMSEIEALGESDPASQWLRMDYLESLADIAAEQSGRRTEAAGLYASFINQVQAIDGSARSSATSLRLAAAHRKLASVVDEPESEFRTAIACAEIAMQNEIGLGPARLELCKTLVELAALYRDSGEPTCATETADLAVRLSTADETIADCDDWARINARALSERGLARQLVGQAEYAARDLQRALELRARIAQSNSTDIFASYDLLRASYSMAGAERDRGRRREALDLFQNAAQIGTRLFEFDPTATLWNQNRFRAYHELTSLFIENREVDSASANFLAAEQMLNDVTIRWESDATYDENRAHLAVLAGRLALLRDSPERAIVQFEWAEQVRQGLVRRLPENRGYVEQLAGTYYWLAFANRKLGNMSAAIHDNERAVELYSSLAVPESDSARGLLNQLLATISLADAVAHSDSPTARSRAQSLLDSVIKTFETLDQTQQSVGYENSRAKVERAIADIQRYLSRSSLSRD